MPVVITKNETTGNKVTCPKCGSEIGYFNSEVRRLLVKTCDGNERKDTIICPACFSNIAIND